jgi:hypothetical protein
MLIDANKMAAGTFFDHFYFEATVRLEDLTQDPPKISTTPSVYNVFFEMREQETEEEFLVLYLNLA